MPGARSEVQILSVLQGHTEWPYIPACECSQYPLAKWHACNYRWVVSYLAWCDSNTTSKKTYPGFPLRSTTRIESLSFSLYKATPAHACGATGCVRCKHPKQKLKNTLTQLFRPAIHPETARRNGGPGTRRR